MNDIDGEIIKSHNIRRPNNFRLTKSDRVFSNKINKKYEPEISKLWLEYY